MSRICYGILQSIASSNEEGVKSLRMKLRKGVLGLLCLVASLLWAEEGLVEWIVSKQGKIGKEEFAFYLLQKPSALALRWRQREGEWKTLGPWRKSGGGFIAEDPYFSAFLSASPYKGGLLISCEVTAKQEVSEPLEILLSSTFQPNQWTRQFYPRLPYLILPPTASWNIKFLASSNDWTELKEWPGAYFYPFGVLENEKFFLLWGSLDIGRFALLSPNLIPENIPALAFRPLSLKRDEKFSLQLFLKLFPKSDFRYRDVLRWYLQNCQNSDPLTKNLFSFKERSRRLPEGNLAGFSPLPITDAEGNLTESGKGYLKHFRSRRIGSLWYYAWHRWDETYPTAGSWWGETGKHTAEEIKIYLRALRANGLHPLLYFRQFLAEEGVKENKPPYKDWIGRDERGNPSSGYQYPLPPEAKEEIGIDKVHCSAGDFGNDSFRNWYIEAIKRCMDVYQPAGIAFDMGWACATNWQFSHANPRTSASHGILRLQMEIWEWLNRKYPDMRIIINEAYGTPSQLYADGVLIEGGFAVGKTELDYESAKAVPTTVISFEYPSLYMGRLQGVSTKERSFLVMRYRAKGIAKSDDYAVYVSENVVGREGTAIKLSDLIADGEWHTITVDLRNIPQVEDLKGIAFQVQAEEEEAWIDVDYIYLGTSAEDRPREGEESLYKFPVLLDERNFFCWIPEPTWLRNPSSTYALERVGEFVRFYVKGKGLGMKWRFAGERGLVAQEYMKVLALGACIGGDIEMFEGLLAFSARAMAMRPIIDWRRLDSLDEKIYASGWEDARGVLVAVYNTKEEVAEASIRLSSDLVRKLEDGRIVVLNMWGSKVGEEKVRIEKGVMRARVPPKGGLLIYSKGWER